MIAILNNFNGYSSNARKSNALNNATFSDWFVVTRSNSFEGRIYSGWGFACWFTEIYLKTHQIQFVYAEIIGKSTSLLENLIEEIISFIKEKVNFRHYITCTVFVAVETCLLIERLRTRNAALFGTSSQGNDNALHTLYLINHIRILISHSVIYTNPIWIQSWWSCMFKLPLPIAPNRIRELKNDLSHFFGLIWHSTSQRSLHLFTLCLVVNVLKLSDCV